MNTDFLRQLFARTRGYFEITGDDPQPVYV